MIMHFRSRELGGALINLAFKGIVQADLNDAGQNLDFRWLMVFSCLALLCFLEFWLL